MCWNCISVLQLRLDIFESNSFSSSEADTADAESSTYFFLRRHDIESLSNHHRGDSLTVRRGRKRDIVECENNQWG